MFWFSIWPRLWALSQLENGNVYFLGYKTFVPEEGGDEFDMSSEEESEEELPVAAAENGKAKIDKKKRTK